MDFKCSEKPLSYFGLYSQHEHFLKFVEPKFSILQVQVIVVFYYFRLTQKNDQNTTQEKSMVLINRLLCFVFPDFVPINRQSFVINIQQKTQLDQKINQFFAPRSSNRNFLTAKIKKLKLKNSNSKEMEKGHIVTYNSDQYGLNFFPNHI